MPALTQQGGHAAWAQAAGQRPATQERLSRLVDMIERDITPRLVPAHARPAVPGTTAITPRADEVAAFTALVLARDDRALDAQMAALRARGVSVESLCIDLLAPAARHLGVLWEEDRCHFAEVTVGLGRLQQIMCGLSAAFGTDIEPPAGGCRVLLAPSPGEQHTFGLSMVAEFFARAGWEVVSVMDPMSARLEDRVNNEWFDVVGFSAGSTTRLEPLAACIQAVRQPSHNRAVAVRVGGPLRVVRPELAKRLLSRRVKGL